MFLLIFFYNFYAILITGGSMNTDKFKKFVPYIGLFVFFLLILSLCPISGDDWGNYLVGTKGISNSIENAITLYSTWEGRFISRLLINLLTCNKIIWNILNSTLIVSIIYLVMKLLNPKNKRMTFLLLSMIFLLMNPYMFSQTITWIAGNITYLFVIPLFLFYVDYITEEKYKENNKIQTIFITLLNFIMTMFVEHAGALLVLFNLFFIIYNFIKYKQLDKKLLLYLISSIIGLLIVVMSPGSNYRSSIENVYFNNLSIFDKIKHNILNFVNYSFIYNPFLLILMSITSFILVKKHLNNKYLNWLLYVYLGVFPILIEINYLLEFLKLTKFFNLNDILLIIYFISYIVIIFLIIIFNYKEKNKERIILFYILGILANSIMLISPTWGYRTTFATYLFLSISLISIIDSYSKERKIINVTLTTLSIMFMTFYITLYINVFRAQNDLEESIKKQLKDDNQVIEINKFPSFVNCNINPENDFHLERFKEYYNIPKEKDVVLKEKYWKYQIFYKK